MREILFRGKRKDNGEWVYGDVAHSIRSANGRKLHKSWIVDGYFSNGGWLTPLTRYAVIDETVGQYTGLNDKNGTRIFEGDIVKVLNAFNAEVVFKKGAFGVYSSYVDYDYLDSEIAEITGCNNPSHFCRCDNFVSLWELMWNYNQEDDCCSVVEIIGNIHDNGYPF